LVLAVALTSAVAGVSRAAPSVPSASAKGQGATTSAYTAIGGPNYPTSTTLSTYHQLDCSTANPYFQNGACVLNVDTQSGGCLWETQSTDNGVPPHPSPCRVTINGPVPWRSLSAYCHLGTTENSLTVKYWIGGPPGTAFSPITFYATPTLTPRAFNGAATATVSYTLKVTATDAAATATGQSTPVAVGSILEVFTVDFAYPVKDVCPNADTDRYSIGNVRDQRRDVVAQDNAATGFIKAVLGTQ
jgi:hypothetical protein